ncbi:MAG: acyl-CoA carboxylase biotin carboxyl carrier protein subunit [Acidobacteriaceae bacterium]
MLEIEANGQTHRIDLKQDLRGNGWLAILDGEEYAADLQTVQANVLSLLIAGKSYRVLFDPRMDGNAVVLDAARIRYEVSDPRSLRARSRIDASHAGARPVKAPMPGRIVRILVEVGDSVEAQQGLLVMEAMKMQNELKSPKSGKVAQIVVQAGATVQPGQVLVVIE